MLENARRATAESATRSRDIADRDTWRMLAIVVGVAATPAVSWASVFTAPTGLAAGSSYRLMFISADQTSGKSTSISQYNSFVTSEAQQNALLPTTTWSAIVSTGKKTAIANTDGGSITAAAYTSDPIYMVDGTEVVASLENFFAANGVLTGSNFQTSLMIHILNADQNGSPFNGGYIWSGSNTDGSKATRHAMGSHDPQTWSFFYDGTPMPGFPEGKANDLPVIGISAPILVGTPVPEPASAPLLATATAMLAALGLRRRSRSRA